MKPQGIVLALTGIVLVVAGTSSAQQVKTDYDRSANFGQYKTYSWKQVKTSDPLWVDRIKNSVNAALAEKGWTQVDSGGDVSICAIEITQDQQTLNTFYDGFGGGGVGDVLEAEALEMQPPQLKPIRWARWSSIYSIPRRSS